MAKSIAKRSLDDGESLSIRKGKPLLSRIYDQRYLLLMILPCIVWLIIFAYIPMGYIVIAFQNFRPARGVFGSDWVGLMWFQQLFTAPMALRIIRNTLTISFFNLIFGFSLPIILALMINEVRRKYYLKTVQTISYLPWFFSWVIVIGLFQQLLAMDGGIVNTILGYLGIGPINFFGTPSLVLPMQFFTSVWRNIGFSAIIYIAALSGINPELHEAAMMDGAGRLRRIWHINLPGIRPTIVILFILASGGIMASNFDQLYVMRNDAILERVDVIATYVYHRLLTDITGFSFNTAVSLFTSVVNVILLLIVNFISKKVADESLF